MSKKKTKKLKKVLKSGVYHYFLVGLEKEIEKAKNKKEIRKSLDSFLNILGIEH